MNEKIRSLFGLFVLLFALLIAFTSRWTVFEAQGLKDNPHNRRPLLEQMRTPRGVVTARDGTVLAGNRRIGRGSTKRYTRTYPQGGLFAQALGYFYISRGSSGLEESLDDELAGRQNEFESIVDELLGHKVEGQDVRLTLDPDAQKLALQALAGQKGAVVAMEPATGRIRVMASTPDYNPNDIPGRAPQLNRDPAAPLVNRATQSRYPPGSTFKVVTAAAALDTGRYQPDSTVDGKSPKVISGVPLRNFGGENFGPVSLTDALTHSVNTVWGEVGEKLGRSTMQKYMERFGFGTEPPLDYPKNQMVPSGVFRSKACGAGVDYGRVAIGQECHLAVTPLQMATVAATVANGGVRMKPRLVERVVSKDGRIKRSVRPSEAERVISGDAAGKLAQMMSRVVEEGTGVAARLQGVQVAGKTGTAEIPGTSQNQVWFICFAPINDPKMAIAVTIERTQGEGGTVAAPIAKQVLQALLGKAAQG